jgi:hypothetical protein
MNYINEKRVIFKLTVPPQSWSSHKHDWLLAKAPE